MKIYLQIFSSKLLSGRGFRFDLLQTLPNSKFCVWNQPKSSRMNLSRVRYPRCKLVKKNFPGFRLKCTHCPTNAFAIFAMFAMCKIQKKLKGNENKSSIFVSVQKDWRDLILYWNFVILRPPKVNTQKYSHYGFIMKTHLKIPIVPNIFLQSSLLGLILLMPNHGWLSIVKLASQWRYIGQCITLAMLFCTFESIFQHLWNHCWDQT